MSITNSQAAQWALLAMYAMDMLPAAVDGQVALPANADQRVTAAGWTVVGYLTALDAVFRAGTAITCGDRVYYGFVARNQADPTRYAVMVRGTAGLAEWAEDAEFPPIPHPTIPGATVEQGFWGIYASMTLVTPTGALISANAAAGIANLIGQCSNVMVVGHSLGSAIATYLSLDMALGPLGAKLSACLFASPQPGDAALAQKYDATLNDYRVFNYILDLVPRVPMALGYVSLAKVTVLQPATAEASIRVDILCNHHLICYCAMLDYEAATAPGVVVAADEDCFACILGPETAAPTMAKLLAAI